MGRTEATKTLGNLCAVALGAEDTSPVPHPTLARVLAAWKLTGWRKRMSGSPRADDLIIPTINGTHKDVRKAPEDFREDLERLGLKKRRTVGALSSRSAWTAARRRTSIRASLTGRPMPSDLYRTPAWEARCDAVLKLRVSLRAGRVIPLHPEVAVNGGGGVEAEPAVVETEKEKARRTVPSSP